VFSPHDTAILTEAVSHIVLLGLHLTFRLFVDQVADEEVTRWTVIPFLVSDVAGNIAETIAQIRALEQAIRA